MKAIIIPTLESLQKIFQVITSNIEAKPQSSQTPLINLDWINLTLHFSKKKKIIPLHACERKQC